MKHDFIFITLAPRWLAEVWESRCLWIWILNGLHLFLAGTIILDYFSFLVLLLSIVPRHVWESISYQMLSPNYLILILSFIQGSYISLFTCCWWNTAFCLNNVLCLTVGKVVLWLWDRPAIWSHMVEQFICQVQRSDSKYRQSPTRNYLRVNLQNVWIKISLKLT